MTPIVEFVNSFVGRPGNIGNRAAYILEAMNTGNYNAFCVCRGVSHQYPGVSVLSMGLLGHIPRILNATRIYLIPRFNHRLLDLALFEWFGRRQLGKLPQGNGVRIAHVWDVCPRLLRELRDNGWRVVLDIPIAPTSYVRKLVDNHRVDFLDVNERIDGMERESCALADMIIVPSNFVERQLVEAGVGAEKIRVVEFGVDFPRIMPRDDMSSECRPLEYCFVGNVNRRKGIAELLTAWSDEKFVEDRLHLCGRVFPEARPYIEGVGGGEVRIPGFVNSYDYLKKCDVFVLPSWLEGSAKAVFEAMACGLPVITTPNTGSVIRDRIEGFLVEPGDVAALRNCMLWFKENPKGRRAMGAAARERAQEFSWSRYAQRVLDVYHRVEQCD